MARRRGIPKGAPFAKRPFGRLLLVLFLPVKKRTFHCTFLFPARWKNRIAEAMRFQSVEKLRRIFRASGKHISKHFVSGRVPDTKYLSDRKRANSPPLADCLCAAAGCKTCRKAPKGIFDSLKEETFVSSFLSGCCPSLTKCTRMDGKIL